MRRVALAVAGLVMIGAGPALAQYGYPPRPMMSVGPMPGEDVVGIVRAMGLEPVGPPVQSGSVYIQRAADYYGKLLRVIVDARRAQVLAVEPLGVPGSLYGGPYAATGAPYGRRAYPAYGAPAYGAHPLDDDEFDDGPQRPDLKAMPPRAGTLHPLPNVQGPRPAAKSAAVTPGRTPVPRKRPVAAPQETAGSVEPLQAAPQNTAPAVVEKSAAPAPVEKPAGPALPPVAPLD